MRLVCPRCVIVAVALLANLAQAKKFKPGAIAHQHLEDRTAFAIEAMAKNGTLVTHSRDSAQRRWPPGPVRFKVRIKESCIDASLRWMSSRHKTKVIFKNSNLSQAAKKSQATGSLTEITTSF